MHSSVFSFGNAVIASGQSPQESDCSTVKLFFVNVTPPESDALDGKKDIAHAGGLVLPASAVRPASVHIDDDVVAAYGFSQAGERAGCPGKVECPLTGEEVCKDRCPLVDANRADCPGKVDCPVSGVNR